MLLLLVCEFIAQSLNDVRLNSVRVVSGHRYSCTFACRLLALSARLSRDGQKYCGFHFNFYSWCKLSSLKLVTSQDINTQIENYFRMESVVFISMQSWWEIILNQQWLLIIPLSNFPAHHIACYSNWYTSPCPNKHRPEPTAVPIVCFCFDVCLPHFQGVCENRNDFFLLLCAHQAILKWHPTADLRNLNQKWKRKPKPLR